MFYYRKGSAGSRISPSDVDPDYLGAAKLFHTTGITPALSETALEATRKALEISISNNLIVSFDTNIRPVLWGSIDNAVRVLTPIIEKVDILFTDPRDASILLNVQDVDQMIDGFLKFGVETVVLKMGRKGAIAANRREKVSVQALEVYVEDPIGAGDAFAGTFITSRLKGRSLEESLKRAVIAGSLVVTVRGDEECLPSEEEIDANIYKYHQ
jgi:2-dehydro-3-deoxygluconokinase/2-dehydro-3-deoxygalactonokinase